MVGEHDALNSANNLSRAELDRSPDRIIKSPLIEGPRQQAFALCIMKGLSHTGCAPEWGVQERKKVRARSVD